METTPETIRDYENADQEFFNHNFDLKEEIRSYWSQRAATFDDDPSHRIENKLGKPEWLAFIRQALDLDKVGDLNDLHALDIASGTGEMSRMLCSLGLRVTGLDFSEKMHAVAEEKLKTEKWRSLLCDAEQLLGVEDNTYDFAVTRHLVWTLTEPVRAFNEWHRVLKPGGRLLIVDGDWFKSPSLRFRMRRWLAKFLSEPNSAPAHEKSHVKTIGKFLPYSNGLKASELKWQLKDAGFQYVKQANLSGFYKQAMRGWPLTVRLRQSSENRFALVVEK